jgi:hypothetical protein
MLKINTVAPIRINTLQNILRNERTQCRNHEPLLGEEESSDLNAGSHRLPQVA